MKALVTGGAGFIGLHLVPALQAAGYDVTVLDRAPGGPPGTRYVRGDLLDRDALDQAFADRPGLVVHLAAAVGVDSYCADPLGVIETNVMGSKAVFERSLAAGARVLFSSTSEVFGKNPKVPWSEDDDRVVGSTRLHRWSYSSTKALCEHMLFALGESKGLDFTIVRYFNAYGPGQRPVFVLPAMVQRVLAGKPPRIYGDGRQTRCFTYVGDAVEATMLAARSPNARGEAFNVGSSRETTVEQLAQLVLQAARREDLGVERQDPKEVYGEGYEDLARRIPDTRKAKQVLGWEMRTPLEEGIRRTMAHMRAAQVA